MNDGMKLSISNIGWAVEQDEAVYSIMKEHGYEGLEIAPTRIFPEKPYDRLNQASVWADELKQQFGFIVSSMQSIWYGRQEKLFGTEEERNVLIDYTKRAIDFASVIRCNNLVFGCPKNRFIPKEANPDLGIMFFKTIGDYAADKHTVIGIEANPSIYNTNYINDTAAALKLIEAVNSPGFLLNLDVGTMIQNGETVDELKGKVKFINHVHISEPKLRVVERRDMHQKLRDILVTEDYQGFVSVEMGKTGDLQILENVLGYVKEIFG